jgi:hypothetical protein
MRVIVFPIVIAILIYLYLNSHNSNGINELNKEIEILQKLLQTLTTYIMSELLSHYSIKPILRYYLNN